MRISDWSSDVCSSDLQGPYLAYAFIAEPADPDVEAARILCRRDFGDVFKRLLRKGIASGEFPKQSVDVSAARSEEHTSELQSLMRISYAVFCLKKKKYITTKDHTYTHHTR